MISLCPELRSNSPLICLKLTAWQQLRSANLGSWHCSAPPRRRSTHPAHAVKLRFYRRPSGYCTHQHHPDDQCDPDLLNVSSLTNSHLSVLQCFRCWSSPFKTVLSSAWRRRDAAAEGTNIKPSRCGRRSKIKTTRANWAKREVIWLHRKRIIVQRSILVRDRDHKLVILHEQRHDMPHQ